MKIPSLAALKKELTYLNEQELSSLIVELSKFTRDNKAFLYFKLNEKDQPNLFVDSVKEELAELFQTANTTSFYLTKKSAQGIRRKLNKALKFSTNKTDQIELILFFCDKMKTYGYLKFNHPVISKLFQMQIQKAEKLILKLEDDLQYDYIQLLEQIN